MKKAKLLIVTNRFVIGGPAVHTAMLATGLQDDFEVLMVGGRGASGEQTNLSIYKELQNEPVLLPTLKPSFSIIKDIRYYFQLKEIIAQFQPDIIHTHTAKPGLWGRLAANKLKVKHSVHTYHGHLFRKYFSSLVSASLVGIERRLAKKTDRLICLSSIQYNDIVEHYKIGNAEKAQTIHLGLDVHAFLNANDKYRKQFREEYKIADDEIAIGVVGRIAKIKNLEFFIDVIQILKHKTDVKIRAFIIGDGPEKRNLKHYAIRNNVDYAEYSYGGRRADLVFTSWCKNVPYAMAGLDILALTSFNEGTPMSLLEAQLAAKPVVTTDVGGVKDLVIDNETGSVIAQNNLLGFVNALKGYVENKELRTKTGEKGAKYVLENFSEQAMLSKYRKLYKDLLS